MSEKRMMTYKEAGAAVLLDLMEQDERVFLLGEGVDNVTGVYGHTLPAYRQFGSRRVIDTPLSENGLTGIAIGAALDGLRPILIHQRNDFMLLTMDQLMNQAAKLGFASGGRHLVPLTVLSFIARKPGEGVQHSQSLRAVFAHFPGVKVGLPATPEDVRGMLIQAVLDPEPVIILEHRDLFETNGEVSHEFSGTPYSAKKLAEGKELTIVAMSATVLDALKARTELERLGISAAVIDLRWIRPLDINPVLESVRETGRLLVADTGWPTFGVAAEVNAQVCEAVFDDLKCPPKRLGMAEVPCPASQYLTPHYHPTAEAIVATAKTMFA